MRPCTRADGDDDDDVRRRLEDIATPGWSGAIAIDTTLGLVDANELNTDIEQLQPLWAKDPYLLALQLVPSVGPNELVDIQFDEPTGALTITTSGLLDDSATATRIVALTERADDGLLRFNSGTYGVQCAPGRGHQDFATQPCT